MCYIADHGNRIVATRATGMSQRDLLFHSIHTAYQERVECGSHMRMFSSALESQGYSTKNYLDYNKLKNYLILTFLIPKYWPRMFSISSSLILPLPINEALL